MDSRHGHRGSRTGLLVFALLAVTATLSCTAPADTEGADDSTAPSPAASDPRAAAPVSDASRSSFTLFESGQVRPLALSADKQHLFAVNTPDNRLEVFRIRGNHLDHAASIPVGLEPVAVAVRGEREVWVVNHLSD